MQKPKDFLSVQESDEIYNQFISSVDVVQATRVFFDILVAYTVMRKNRKDLKQDVSHLIDTNDEQVVKATKAIGIMLHEITRKMKEEEKRK